MTVLTGAPTGLDRRERTRGALLRTRVRIARLTEAGGLAVLGAACVSAAAALTVVTG